MLLIDVYLKKSEIEGLGVFARQPVSRGEVMWEFHPDFDRAVPRAVYESTSGPMRNWLDRYGYPAIGDHDTIIFELDDARYMNHSDDPNMVFVGANKGRGQARYRRRRGIDLRLWRVFPRRFRVSGRALSATATAGIAFR